MPSGSSTGPGGNSASGSNGSNGGPSAPSGSFSESGSGNNGSSNGNGSGSESESQSMSSCASSSASGCGLKEFKVPQWVNASGGNSTVQVKVPTSDPNMIGGYVKFKVSAKFKNECKCCEYRQSVRGYFRVHYITTGWQDETFALGPSTFLSRTDWNEDAYPINPAQTKFYRMGHRSDQKYKEGATGPFFYAPSDKYSPFRSNGCSYSSDDSPIIERPRSQVDAIEVHLEFKGQIIDTCNPGDPVDEKTWSVDFQFP